MYFLSNLFKGRVSRKQFILSAVAYLVFIFLIGSIVGILKSFSEDLAWIFGFFFQFIFILIIILSISLSVRRMHDIGFSGKYIILILIPFANLLLSLYLLIKGGEEKNNKYGNVPPKEFKFIDMLFNLNFKEEIKNTEHHQ